MNDKSLQYVDLSAYYLVQSLSLFVIEIMFYLAMAQSVDQLSLQPFCLSLNNYSLFCLICIPISLNLFFPFWIGFL